MPTVSIAGKKITLAWVAATQADADAIASYLPQPHADGSAIQPSELTTSLPASIHVKLELRVEGATVATGGTYSLGTQLTGAGAFTTYQDLTQYDQTQDQLVAGQQSALGVSVQGVSNTQLSKLQSTLTTIQAGLQAHDSTNLTGEAITGNALTEGIWGYFSSLQQFADIARSQNSIIDHQGLSYGLFHVTAQPNQLYGIVTISASFKGVNMDVGHMRYLRWMQNDADVSSAIQHWVAYNQLRGQHASLMESEVPEQMFVDHTQCQYLDSAGNIQNAALAPCQQGISATKAMMFAAQQGQKLLTITQANASVAIPMLQQSASVIQEVSNAVAAGKTVAIHQSPINAYGWSGAGYIETDPATGMGAYLIEGKGNGGSVAIEAGMTTVLAVIGLAGVALGASLFFSIAIALISIWLSAMLFFIAYTPCGNWSDSATLSLTMSMSTIGAIFGIPLKIGPATITALVSWIYSTAPGAMIGGHCGSGVG